MFSLAIIPMCANEYSIQIQKSTMKGSEILWFTKSPEIDLEETIQKVLRISNNLRKVPD